MSLQPLLDVTIQEYVPGPAAFRVGVLPPVAPPFEDHSYVVMVPVVVKVKIAGKQMLAL